MTDIKLKEFGARSELNQQADNLEAEIKELEQKIKTEKAEANKIEEIVLKSQSEESTRGSEEKVLDDLQESVLGIYESCIGQNEESISNVLKQINPFTILQAMISTVDMLHHIEMKMENLTQELEALNTEKVSKASKGLFLGHHEPGILYALT